MWNDGYISEIDYVHNYFVEQSPCRMRLALLSRGSAPAIGPRPAYLELGFGRGLSLAVHAATSGGVYYGTDYNPSQAAAARSLVAAAGCDVRIFEDSFEELAQREDLPQFDVITLHGVWSWVQDRSRTAIVDLARRYLKPGGAFYISYNTLPGWSPVTPLRHLLNEYAKRETHGPILSRVDESIGFAEKMIEVGARYFVANPGVADRLKLIKSQNRTYVTHEYFNQIWEPMTFAELSDRLAVAKLGFGASANLLDNRDPISVPQSALELVRGISDPTLAQMVRDFVLNQQFRRDIFVKGPRTLSRGELRALMLDQWFVLVGDGSNPPRKLATPAGEAELRPQIYEPVCTAIAKRTAPFRIGDLRDDAGCRALTEWEVWDALIMLSAAGHIAPAQAEEDFAGCIEPAQRLNREILRQAEFSSNIPILASPVTNSAVIVSRVEQLLIAGRMKGVDNPVGFAASVLNGQGEKLIVDGKPLADEAAMLASLGESWARLEGGKLSVLAALGVI